MHWRNDRTAHGYVLTEKVQVYQLEYSSEILNPTTHVKHRRSAHALVVALSVEDAIAITRQQWPDEFELHSINKQNARCDLLIHDSVLPLAESTKQPAGE